MLEQISQMLNVRGCYTAADVSLKGLQFVYLHTSHRMHTATFAGCTAHKL